ncbi:MAG TPA: hypothetical protein VMU57_16180 [Edaphobacter sp.]|uniref:hypothetical protein n=1 Tax=Edaphobacter sp. TaxID=1934404 RepID=UPI002C651D1D|nr:hypothetical protein [Edaphobacter sp.]HUZ96442.1 hypothetical protein [Edaphobacter sp.]
MFDRYIGIDYSGAKTPTSSLSGLRIYMADMKSMPTEVLPPLSPRKYWTRRGMAECLSSGFPKSRRRSSELIMVSHSQCSILSSTACLMIGRHSLTTSKTIGQLTMT